MGALDDLVKQVAGEAGGTGPHAAMATAVLGMLNSQGSGGLQSLTEALAGQGLGHVLSSWIGTGSNLPISPDQVHSALGADKMQQLAQQAGVSPDIAKTLLAAVLPLVVDKLTPGGAIPTQQSLVGEGLGLLAKKFL